MHEPASPSDNLPSTDIHIEPATVAPSPSISENVSNTAYDNIEIAPPTSENTTTSLYIPPPADTFQPTPDHTYAAYSLLQPKSRTPNKLLEECVPKSYRDIPGNPYENHWFDATQKELRAMEENNVFDIVCKNKQMRPLDSKWVFTVKYNDSGEPYAKARLVARGFRDKTSYEIADTYSPVVNQWLIRWAISIANKYRLLLTKFDVSTAFLNAAIHSPTYHHIPEEMSANSEKSIIQLRRSIYGLKTGSKSWYTTLDDTILTLGFTRSKADRCLYFQKMPNKSIALLLVYVDDMMLLTDSADLIQSTKTVLQEKFKMTFQADPNFFVGFEICRNTHENIITLKQTKYINRILARFEMDQCNPQTTPMEI